MVTVLFTGKKSNYLELGGFDCWGVDRDALTYSGDDPVVCHPPCRRFSKMRAFSTAIGCEEFMAYWSVSYVRNHGGIVEHPRSSTLWEKMGVGTPRNPDRWGGYMISVNMHWFGYPARKKTGLYIVGIDYKDLPAVPLRFDAVTHCISQSRKTVLKELHGEARSLTPVDMCLWFREVIGLISKKHFVITT